MSAHKRLLRSTLITAALAAITLGAQAEDEAARLKTPESTFVLGIGHLGNDNQRFGQFTGLRDEGLYAIVDVDWVNRDDPTGTWLRMGARNLGMEHGEATIEWLRQGQWGLAASYSRTPRYDPYLTSASLAGIGGHEVTVGGLSPGEAHLKARREEIRLDANRRFLRNVSFEINYRHEQRDGARQFARGTPGAMEFLAEPLDQTVHQLEATLSYAGRRLQLAGGYYATAFDNAGTALEIIGGAPQLSGGDNPFTPIALPPDNSSHQLFISGGYNLAGATRATFKAAYSRLTQEDPFILPSVTARTDLGGRLDVTFLQAALTARPLPRLSLLANLRYEDRDDKTPIARYLTTAGPTSTFDGDNEPFSIRTRAAKAEASYSLPWQMRFTAGLDYAAKRRSAPPVRTVSARPETRELSYRVELRRTLAESLSGVLSCVRSHRDGSPFLTTVLNNGEPGSNLVAPLQLADRDRDKLRLLLDWMPLEALSVQWMTEYAEDEYGGRELGLKSGRAHHYSLDATYLFTDKWQVTGWGSRGVTRARQLMQTNAPTGQFWSADLRNRDQGFGIEMRGRLSSRLDTGAGLQRFDYRDEYGLAAITGAPIAPIPDVFTRQTTANIFASYALNPDAGLRLDVVHDRWRSDEWSWTNWVYTDGARRLQQPRQEASFVAVSVYFKLR